MLMGLPAGSTLALVNEKVTGAVFVLKATASAAARNIDTCDSCAAISCNNVVVRRIEIRVACFGIVGDAFGLKVCSQYDRLMIHSTKKYSSHDILKPQQSPFMQPKTRQLQYAVSQMTSINRYSIDFVGFSQSMIDYRTTAALPIPPTCQRQHLASI